MGILETSIGRTICGAGIGYIMQTYQLMNVNWKAGAVIGAVASLVEGTALAILKNEQVFNSIVSPWTPLGGAGAAWYALKFKFNVITSYLGPISNPNLSFAEVFLFNFLTHTTTSILLSVGSRSSSRATSS